MKMRKSEEHNKRPSSLIHNVHGEETSGISQGQNYFNETPSLLVN